MQAFVCAEQVARTVEGGNLISPNPTATTRVNYPARRPMHPVNFFCHAPNGRWLASLELPRGHHRYLFLVDVEPTLDPHSYGTVRSENNEKFSLLAVS